MTNINNNQSEIISPTAFINYASGDKLHFFDGVDMAILCYDSSLFNNYISKEFKGKTISELIGTVIIYNNIAIGGNFGIGAPSATAFMEELIACGIKRIIGIGTAGSLLEHINIGDVVVCSKAISDEGISKHYFQKIFRIVFLMVYKIASPQ